jgi:nicotinamidase-related amidase
MTHFLGQLPSFRFADGKQTGGGPVLPDPSYPTTRTGDRSADKASLSYNQDPYDRSFAHKKGGTAVLVIDPQNDFHEGGSLAVAGAKADSGRTAQMILDHLNDIHQISVTLDSHLKLHIANPFFWTNKEGQHPPPFTPITEKDINDGTWVPSRPELLQHALLYVRGLDTNKRFSLLVWPEHCLIGTAGHNVAEVLNSALQTWSGHNLDIVNYINKGTCPLTEMYSGLKADVELKHDASTQLNHKLVARLLEADRVLICGQALSHCVQFTTRDLVAHWPKNRLKDVWLIEDQCSAVGGFEKAALDFVADMRTAGVTVCKTEDAFPKRQ